MRKVKGTGWEKQHFQIMTLMKDNMKEESVMGRYRFVVVILISVHPPKTPACWHYVCLYRTTTHLKYCQFVLNE